MAVQPPERFGKYRLERLLGEGGMAKVYKAVADETGQVVALKVLEAPPHINEAKRSEMVARFQREALAASALSHPHIVRTLQVGMAEGRHYIAMELVEGHTLAREIELGGAMPPQRALQILEQVTSALQAVHELGIVHRDVKPENIMLLHDGSAKLTDFGVARLHEEGFRTSTGEVIGSPDYMSPEQARGEAADARADVFSLATVFWETLAGRKCFSGSTVAEVVGKILHDEPPELPPSLSRFEPVLRKAMAKDPGSRYQSVTELLTAARLAARGSLAQPAEVEEEPAPAPQRASTPARRAAAPPDALSGQGWVIGLAGLILLLFAMTTLQWYLALVAGLTGILTATMFRRPWYGMAILVLSLACIVGLLVLRGMP